MFDRDPLQRMRRQMEEMWEETMDSVQERKDDLSQRGWGFPSRVPLDIQETGDEIIVKADLPGVDRDDIQLRVTAEEIEVGAEMNQEETTAREGYYLRERGTRRFYRSASLPAPVKPSRAEASYQDGVLTVRLEKTGEERWTDIQID